MKTNIVSIAWQFIKFGIIGAFNTVVSYTVYSISYHLFNFSAQISNVFGFVISVFSAFLLQGRFVFNDGGEKRVWWKVLIKTYASYAFTGLVLTSFLLWLWLDLIDLGQYFGTASVYLSEVGINMSGTDIAASVAPFMNMVITIPLNFLINKFWAYKSTKKAAE